MPKVMRKRGELNEIGIDPVLLEVWIAVVSFKAMDLAI